MRVASARMKNFKRFTDLLIADIPESAKLVVLVGPNGCGKSSVFDALLRWHRNLTGLGSVGDPEYYDKSQSQRTVQIEPGEVQIELHGGVQPGRESLYIRTAYRNDADFRSNRIDIQNSPVDTPVFNRLIEDDKTVSGNYQRLLLNSIRNLYSEVSKQKLGGEIVDELIGEIRKSMMSVFGDLYLNTITEPLGSNQGSGAFYFRKGSVNSYHYKNLSGGEKAAFDLVLDVHLKKHFFPDAIYCIDEIESHLHTKVQGSVLKELFKIVPDPSQLWITTHSLGVLRAAQEIGVDSPGSVCLINFDGVGPDIASEVVPTRLDRVSWEKMLSITLDDLSDRVAPEFIVVCEGSSVGSRRPDFDAYVYERILGPHEPGIVFVSGGNSAQVTSTGSTLGGILERVLPQTRVIALADRDDKSQEEVAQFDGIILSRRNIESYLLANDVIDELLMREGKLELRDQALQVKHTALKNSIGRRHPADDLKSAAGEIYVGLKRLLDLRGPGSNKDAFMQYTLSQLITPGMETYQALKSDIVDKIRAL